MSLTEISHYCILWTFCKSHCHTSSQICHYCYSKLPDLVKLPTQRYSQLNFGQNL